MIFKVHPRTLSNVNNHEFSWIFNGRGVASSWDDDIIWSYFTKREYRYFSWQGNHRDI